MMDSNQLVEQQPEQDSSILLDFSNMFKQQAPIRKRVIQKEEAQENQETVFQNKIPRNVTITQEQMAFRKCLDLRRWYCLSRPQYQRTCGISSVVTCWNYLFSTLGTGQLQPISNEEAIVKLGLAQEKGTPFNDIEFGKFSGNMNLMKWFKSLCRIHKVQGRAYYMWRVQGETKTVGVDRQLALQKLEAGLRTDKTSFIYHCYDHYFAPIGYEITPQFGPEAYLPYEEINQEKAVHWIIIGEPAKPNPFFTVRKWDDIAKDIEMEPPNYFNIRKMDEGVKESKKTFVGQHCIMAFERVDPIQKKGKKEVNKQDEVRMENQENDELQEQKCEQNGEKKQDEAQQKEIEQVQEEVQKEVKEQFEQIGEQKVGEERKFG